MSDTINQVAEELADEPVDDLVVGHSYDGIQEYDNPTPGWWNWIFIASVVMAPFYVMWFHSPTVDRDLAGQYERAFAKNLQLQFGEIGELEPTQANLLKYMDDKKWLTVGQVTFSTYCVSCHGRQAEGVSAPNLTDEYYKNVKEITDIAKVITNGANNGAMPAWGNRLHPNEVVLTAAYVASLRGKNESSTRAAEGNEIQPWPTSTP